MSREWLVYWRMDQIKRVMSDRLLDHAATEQFGMVKPGDTLWVSGSGRKSRLVTVGPLKVAEVVDQKEAERRLQYKLWKAKYHALAAPSAVAPAREVSLAPIVADLRFVSRTTPKLNAAKPLGQQLQRIRQLTSTSAERLRREWSAASSGAAGEFDEIQARLHHLEQLDVEGRALRRREQSFLREYLFGSDESGNVCHLWICSPSGVVGRSTYQAARRVHRC